MQDNVIPDIASMPVGTVMKCTRLIDHKRYTFVWFKATDHFWYVTGRQNAMTNSQFANWLRRYRLETDGYVAKEWETIEIKQVPAHAAKS